MTGIGLRWTGWGTVVLVVAGLVAPVYVTGQDGGKPEPLVESEDLGDGLRLVSVNGGPPALVDTRTGWILKLIEGRPAVIDKQTGVMLYSADGGEPQLYDIKSYFGQGKGSAKAPEAVDDPETLGRMRETLQRMEARGGAKEDDGPRTDPWEARARRYRELLGVAEEEFELVILPILRAILIKQDEIRRSTIGLAQLTAVMRLGKGRTGEKGKRIADLPPGIRAFHEVLLGGEEIEGAELRASLAGFREAREKQDEELDELRSSLREVLTVIQEARLTAVGVLN